MSGTQPHGWSYARYLSAKVSVDDRALCRGVLDQLRAELAARKARRPLAVSEIGGGTGTMVRRLVEWKILSHAHYTLLDVDAALLAEGLASLEAWARGAGISVERRDAGELRLHRASDALDLTVHAQHAELADFVSARADTVTDVLIASAFLDLVELPRVLPELVKMLSPGGLCWLPINFDAETTFEPAHPLDTVLLSAYHRSMDERIRYGRPAGDSRTGRKLFHALEGAGTKLLAAGSSDWVVFARDGRYPADEAYFLGCILSTIEEALAQRADVPPANLATWMAARREQLEAGALVYVAHQLDFLAARAE